MKCTFYALVAASIIFSKAIAQEDYESAFAPVFKPFNHSNINDGVNWLDWEIYDPRTGTISVNLVDLVLPGVIPISLERHRGYGGMSFWFSRPMLTIHPYQGNCQSAANLERTYNFSDGSDTNVTLFSTALSGNSDISRFPYGAVAISPDNWYISCGVSNTYIVHSPEGIKYEMGVPREPDDVRYGTHLWEANKVSDIKGNWVSYEYVDDGFCDTFSISKDPCPLKKISSNDGRQITIQFEASGSGTQKRTVSATDVSGETLSLTHLISINSNFEYVSYPDGTQNRILINNTSGVLSGVNTKEGGRTRYTGTFKRDHVAYDTSGNRNSPVAYTVHNAHVLSTRRYLPISPLSEETTTFAFNDLGGDKYTRTIDGANYKSVFYFNKSRDRTWQYPSPMVRARNSQEAASDGRPYRFTKYTNGTEVITDVDLTWSLSGELAFSSDPTYEYLGAGKSYISNVKVKNVNGRSTDIQTTVLELDDYNRETSVEYTSNYGRKQVVGLEYKNITFPIWRNGLVTSQEVKNSDGDVVDHLQLSYFDDGYLKRETVNNVISSSFTYHGDGNVRTVADGEGRAVTYTMYVGITPTEIRNKDGDKKTRTLGFGSRLETETNWGQTGEVHTYSYDTEFRLSGYVSPRSQTAATTITWPNAYHKVEATGRREQHTVHDGFGNTVFSGVKDTYTQQWISTIQRYENGRLVFKSNPGNYAWDGGAVLNSNLKGTAYEYDGEGKMTRVDFPGGVGNTQYEYNTNQCTKVPCLVQVVGGKTTVTEYESFGGVDYEHIRKYIEADGTTTTISVDEIGRVESVSRDGATRTLTYNTKKQLEKIKHPETGETIYTYFADGMIKTKHTGGVTTTYVYFPDNKIKEIKHGNVDDGTGRWVRKEYRYDAENNMEYAKSSDHAGYASAVNELTWDEDGNKETEKVTVNGVSLEQIYEYDEIGSLSSTTFPGGNQYSYQPDAFGRPTQIGGSGKTIASEITFHPNGMVKRMINPGGVYEQEVYDHNRPMSGHTTLNNTVVGAKYFYDTSGNLSKFDVPVANKRLILDYTDNNYLLASSIETDPDDNRTIGVFYDHSRYSPLEHTYTYDKRGNMKTYDGRAITINRSLNRVTKDASGRTINYDGRGNITNNGQGTLRFNHANQLYQDFAGGKFAYDANNHRVYEQLGTQSDVLLYADNGTLLFRYGVNTENATEYFYIGGTLYAKRDIEGSTTSTGGGSGGTPTCQSASSDPDGDGWGWENGQSCIVNGGSSGGSGGSSSSSGTPVCQSASSDPDGDGWGWENGQSCIVDGSGGGSGGNSGGTPTCQSASSDPDGDGWGWENGQSCRVAS